MTTETDSNPFNYGNPVKDDYYLPRPDLNKLVKQFVASRVHTVLIGPRRFGKTSFVLNLLRELEEEGAYVCIFADIFNITSHRDFLQQILRAIRQKENWGHRFRKWAENVPRLRPRVEWQASDDGQLSFSLSADVTDDRDVKETIHDVLSGIGELGDRVVFSIDEFQQITELQDQGWLEATLRMHMQQLENVVFIFTGSRQGVIRDMLNDRGRPFYRSCQSLEFPAFGEEFTDWVVERFSSIGINCDRDAITALRDAVQNTPNYVQMACFHLVAHGVKHVTIQEIHKILGTICQNSSYAFQTLLNSLSPVQQRVLRLAAIENEKIFSRDVLAKYEIKNTATLASSVSALKEKQILDESSGRGRVVFDDPLFAIWLRHEFKMDS